MRLNPATNVKLATIVPAFNESRLIHMCLDGLREQSLPPTEVLIVDDSSTDDTVEKALAYGRRFPSLGLRVVRHRKVGGYDIMGNYTDMLLFGWASLGSKPDYFAVCDADTLLHSDYYQKLISVMGGRDRIGIAGGELLPTGGMEYWWRKKKVLGVYPYVYGCNRVYRKGCWEELVRNHDPVDVLSYVGIDTYHALMARAMGWQVVKDSSALSTALRPPASLVSSRLKGISSYLLGYSLPQIIGRAAFNRDRGYLDGWLWAHSQGLPKLSKIQPLVQALFWRRIFRMVAHS